MADASAVERIFEEEFRRLVRGQKTDLSGLIHQVDASALGDGTAVECHTYSLSIDGNGRPQVKDLARQVLARVLDYALPRRAVQDALNELKSSGSTAKFVNLTNEARALFVKSATSGEGGELLISLIAETRLGLPQVLCKMDLKTSTPMHFHGADGIHVGWNSSQNRLNLFWGESKLRPGFGAATDECLSDLKKYLTSTGGSHSADDRDLQLVARHLDMLDENLEKAVLGFFDPNNPNYKKYQVCGIALVGFDGGCYPSPPTDMTSVLNATKAKLAGWQKTISSKVTKLALSAFIIHFICLPFPSVDEFRKALMKELGV